MTIVGVFINKTEHVISGFEADLFFGVKSEAEAELTGTDEKAW